MKPLVRVPGVYQPQRDSMLLAAAASDAVRAGDRVLDLFTGTGIVAIDAAAAGAGEVDAVDVSRRAVACARTNARLRRVRLRAHLGNLFEPVAEERFDLVLANPPYVPDPGSGAPAGAARAWDAGPDGRRFLDPLIAQLPRHLLPGGRVLIVHSSLCGIERTLLDLERAGLDATPISSETAPLGPITAPRTEALERLGVLGRGERTEATVVIQGVVRNPVAIEEPVAALSLS